MKKATPPRLVIGLPDYLRIFRVMNAVMDGLNSDRSKCCLFFSVTGAAILKHFYRKDARVLAGSAFYLLDDPTSSVLAITKFADGELHKGVIDSDRSGFHCWVECEGQVIDFQAPVFPEALAQTGNPVRIPRKMFQKPRALMVAGPTMHDQVGDFYLQPNLALTNDLVPGFLDHPASKDLMNICMTWFTRPPKSIQRTFAMGNDVGEIFELQLSEIDLSGAW